jgi:RsmE family RNA methyltransferase
VNFLLLHAAELDADGTAVLCGRRAEHARSVLRVEPGQQLRAGIVDGQLGTATVLEVAADRVVVTMRGERTAEPCHDVLLLAVPRPKVLLRLYGHAAALGFGHLVLFRSWRTDKSHLDSTAMRPAVQQEQLLLGLEQAGRTRVPRVTFCSLFKPMVEDTLPSLGLPLQRFVAHPTAQVATPELAPLGGAAFALAIGPDGGLLPYEVDALQAQGFLPVHCGPWPLRTETALAALTAQLQLLRARRA